MAATTNPTAPAPHQPQHRDAVEQWLMGHRDTYLSSAYGGEVSAYDALDAAIDDYRQHSDEGTTLPKPAGDDHE